MSKRSRTFQPSAARPDPEDQPAPSGVSGGAAGTGSSAPGTARASSRTTSRAEARRRSSAPRVPTQQSFFERYKLFIIGGAGAIVVVLGLLFFTRTTTQAYECVTFLTPPPVQSPAPGQTPLPGFPTQDMGKEHAVQGASIRYDYCPPASGRHFNLGGGQAPLARRFFGPSDTVTPGQWIHNLEHGFVVLLYRGDPGPEVLEQLRSIMEQADVSDWASQQCGPVNKVIALRFDDLGEGIDFAAVAWDRVLLLEEFDGDQLLAFANQWQDGPQTPERVCA